MFHYVLSNVLLLFILLYFMFSTEMVLQPISRAVKMLTVKMSMVKMLMAKIELYEVSAVVNERGISH